MSIVKLSKYEVEIKDQLGWYDLEEVRAVISSGAKLSGSGLSGFDGRAMLEAKLKLFELSIVSIKDGEGKDVKYSVDWVKSLSAEDGETLDSEVDKMSSSLVDKKIGEITAQQIEGKASATPYVIMELLSSEYGWTPDEIREMSPTDIHAYLKIIDLKRRINQKNAKQSSTRNRS